MCSFPVFLRTVFGHWGALLTGVVVGVFLMVLEYYFQLDVPRWLFVGIVIGTLFIACFLAWRDQCATIELLTRHSHDAVEKLSELRAEAISALLNMPVANDDDVELLIKKQEQWRDRVVACLRDHHASEPVVRSFLYLGVLRVVPFGKKNPTHERRLQILARQLEVIENLIGQYSALLTLHSKPSHPGK